MIVVLPVHVLNSAKDLTILHENKAAWVAKRSRMYVHVYKLTQRGPSGRNQSGSMNQSALRFAGGQDVRAPIYVWMMERIAMINPSTEMTREAVFAAKRRGLYANSIRLKKGLGSLIPTQHRDVDRHGSEDAIAQ